MSLWIILKSLWIQFFFIYSCVVVVFPCSILLLLRFHEFFLFFLSFNFRFQFLFCEFKTNKMRGRFAHNIRSNTVTYFNCSRELSIANLNSCLRYEFVLFYSNLLQTGCAHLFHCFDFYFVLFLFLVLFKWHSWADTFYWHFLFLH